MNTVIDKISIRDAFGNILAEMAEKDEKIMYLAADTMSVGGTKFHKLFPKRALNVGIAEQNMALMGVGMAACGAKVFVASYAVFASMRMCEQIRTFMAYTNLDVKVVAGMGGLSGSEEGVTHQGTEDVSIMRSIPNMVVIVPADVCSTEVITRAVVEHKGPMYIRLGKDPSPNIFDSYKFEIGKANIIEAEGTDAALICNGPVTLRAINAAEILRKAGYGIKLIEMPCVKPIDREAVLFAAKECGLIITMEDNNILGGLGSAVAEVIGDEGCNAVVRRMGLPDEFAQSGNFEELLDYFGFKAEELAETVKKEIMNKTKVKS